jgi:hypothetical protein
MRELVGELLTGDGETTETPPLLQSLRLSDCGLGGDDDGVQNEAVLETLDLADHLGLVVLGAVVVDHTKTTEQGNVDSHVVLSDCVHGRRDERSLEGDALCDRGIEGDIGGREAWRLC